MSIEEEEIAGVSRFKRNDLVTLLKDGDGLRWRVLRTYWLARKGYVCDIQCEGITMFASAEGDLVEVAR